VKIPDVNVLLYAEDELSPHHTLALRWFTRELSGTEPVGFAWSVLLGFVRLSTRAQVFTRPLQPAAAFELVEGWLQQPAAVVIHPTDRHLAIFRGLIEEVGTAGNLTTDAHLAALAIEHGGEVVSADMDFARFRGLRWTNPLASRIRHA
jgi:toxin-antitoxin system PIN domain toxin